METYEGSADADGFISDINSTAGYIFNQHFSKYGRAVSFR
jgi:hypothetical protein